MADQEVKIRIITDASGAVTGFKTVRDEVDKTEKHSAGLVSKIKGHWLGLTAAVAGAAVTLSKAWDLAYGSAQYLEAMQNLSGLAAAYGTTATEITNKIQSIGDGMISMATSADVAYSGLAKNLKPDMLYGLAKAATVLNDSMGMTADEAFANLASAMELNKQKSLKLAVGTIDLRDRYGDLASKMSEAEKQTAFYNLIMEKTNEISTRLGGNTKSTADKMETFQVKVANLKTELGIMTLTIIDNILPAMDLLDKELAKDSGATWGKKFVLAMIPIEAEIYRLAMLLDKLGGTVTSAQMLLYGPGRALGVESSTKRFEAAADANMMYQKRYEESDAALVKLAQKETQLQNELAGNVSSPVAPVKPAVTATGGGSNRTVADKSIESLIKSWKEMAMTIAAKMESQGLDELGKKLRDNQLEADQLKEKYKALPKALRASAYETIDKQKTGLDIKAYEDAAIEQMKKEIELGVEATKSGIDRIKERGDAARDMYKDMKGYEQEYYKESLKLIDDQVGRFRAAALDEIAIEKWKEEQKRLAKLQQSRTVTGGSFAAGWSQGAEDWVKDLGNDFTQAEKMAKSTANAMSSSFSTVFFDAAKGDMQDFKSYFSSFLDSLLKSYTNMLADMLTKWIMNMSMMQAAQSGFNWFTTVLGGVINAVSGGLGGSGALINDHGSLANVTAESVSAYNFHTGGIVGQTFNQSMMPAYAFAGAPRFHRGFAPDEFPAILQRGEAVIPKNKVNSSAAAPGTEDATASITNNTFTIHAVDAKSFAEICKRNPDAIVGPMMASMKNNKTRTDMRSLLK